jgi:hypothetical protein
MMIARLGVVRAKLSSRLASGFRLASASRDRLHVKSASGLGG